MLSPSASSGVGEILDRLGALLAGAGLTLFRWPPQTERYVLGPASVVGPDGAEYDEAGYELLPRRSTLH
jgi:hypothetical protein